MLKIAKRYKKRSALPMAQSNQTENSMNVFDEPSNEFVSILQPEVYHIILRIHHV